jgi:hypothetical protein
MAYAEGPRTKDLLTLANGRAMMVSMEATDRREHGMGTARSIESSRDRASATVFRSNTEAGGVFLSLTEREFGKWNDDDAGPAASTVLSPAEARELGCALIAYAASAEHVAVWGERGGAA